MRERVVVYVEREDGLLVFDHRDDSEAGTQVPAGGVEAGEDLADAVRREVLEETGVRIEAEPTPLGVHEHLDGLGQPTRSHFFRVDAPEGLPRSWEQVVGGEGIDAGMTFSCRFESTPELWAHQAVFLRISEARAD